MSGNPTDDNTYGYALRFWEPLPDGIHSCQASWATNAPVIFFKWKATTPEANVAMSKRFFEALNNAGSEIK